ncbi:branched chain amino acid aminotransferase [Planktothrix agardhii CCAP 1459/11A]|uniref:branched-chain-amino-acid transaminase n=1 Tax=Planktothrix agardhii CCAP 1459/11A TaxID=282420 RepID=A0A4P5ZEW3_PLAAG|nr:branched-chain amino acid aminotransferase [Planktothrix agardhii]GDZ94598.1 branched chain amino acid aminotransferase [Planktothrix agardhii CCAP 1459/11A]
METLTEKILIQKTEDSRLSSETLHNIPFGRIFSDHIFIATYNNGTWQDLKIIPYGNLTMAPAMAVLHYGQAVFEGMKAYKSATGETLIFRPDANFRRINQSAHRLCMPPIPESVFMEGLTELIRLDSGWIPESEGSLYIRPLYFANDEFIGLKPSTHYTFIIMSCPVGAYYSEPVKLIVTDKYIRACEGGTGAAKCAGNYAASLLADKEAKALGYDNVIWLDGVHKKYVEECGTMNLAFVINNVVVTPQLTGTILEGITRDSVLKLFRDQGVKVEERLISIEEVAAAHDQGILQEAFGMGTAATIAQVSKIGYQGRDLVLPPISERKYAPSILEQLEAIKTGKEPDPYNWICKI